MSIKPQANYNSEDLFLFCELTSYPEIGKDHVDFTGIKTYNIGFMKEGLGFGITNINIEITPSLQPVIEITFKDFYGNLAIEFSKNKDFINGLTDSSGIDDFNYSSIFELPYPKFKLTFKGYIGLPGALDLNVKRIDVLYIPSDGSYEIKATFIPNLYGFFSDMPFYFLKAVKYMVNDGNLDIIKNDYYSVFDIIEASVTLQQQQQIINKKIELTKKKLQNLYDLSGNILEDDFNFDLPISNVDPSSNGKKIGNMNMIFINIADTLSKSNNSKTSSNKSALRSGNVDNAFQKKIVASITEILPNSKKIYLFDDKVTKEQVERGRSIIKKAIDECVKYEQGEFATGNKDVIRQVTIQKVMDLLVRDSAYLMGRILEAGVKGFNQDSSRRINSKDLVGKYFPVKQDNSTNELIPATFSGPEEQLVNEFLRAYSKGAAEEVNKNLQTSSTASFTNSGIIKRITNLEVGSQNPYYLSSNSSQLISNLLIRTGLLSHFYMDNLFTIISDSNKNDIIDSEFENFNAGLSKLEATQLNELTTFCQFIKAEIDEDGKFVSSTFKSDAGKIESISSYLPSNSRISFSTLTAKEVLHNNIFYKYPYDGTYPSGANRDSVILIYKTNELKNKLENFESLLSSSSDETRPFDDNSFDFKYVDENTIKEVKNKIFNHCAISYELLQNKMAEGKDIIYSSITQSAIDESTDLNKKYVYTTYINNNRDSGYVWDFLGNSTESTFQRRALRNICQRVSSKIIQNEGDKAKQASEINSEINDKNGYNIIYNQFHHLCNNWKNLVGEKVVNSGDITKTILEKFYAPNPKYNNNYTSKIFYEIPLSRIQEKVKKIKLENAIINAKPLQESNSQSSVLNMMTNICHLNNFMFLAIPGLAKNSEKSIGEETVSELFSPYTDSISVDDSNVGNQFYILWMPTPESRVKYNDGTEINFNPIFSNEDRVFEIDYGSVDNTIFKSIQMTTEDNKVTSESAIAINTIADPKSSNKFKNYDCSALSVMEGRSYKISVEMLGNAQIKPTQFFYLNSTHIFRGVYQIMKVSHNIKPNDMLTKFEAIKMKYSGLGNDFFYIPPLTLEGLGISYSPSDRKNNTPNPSSTIVMPDSAGFPINESSVKGYMGTITHPSIDIPYRALLDTVSFLDNGIKTKNNGYDVLVGSTAKNPRLIKNPDWFPNYDKGMDFDNWKILIYSPTKGHVVPSSAAGRYQIIYTTWKDSATKVTVPFTGVITNPKNPPFNKDNQDIVGHFLLTRKLNNGGISKSDIEKSYSNFDLFVRILKSLKGEWESVDLLFKNGKFKGMTAKDVHNFFIASYDIYKK